MSWPTPQQYNEAIQTPLVAFSDPDLRGGRVELNALGLPRAVSGAFANVYKVSNGSTCWAVRCFLSQPSDHKDRYLWISNSINMDELTNTIEFHYLTEGIKVAGEWYPCLKMSWVEGKTLDRYLAENYKHKKKIEELIESFRGMVLALSKAGIAHGDLQHGNIMVTTQGMRLVDYDAFFVPELTGRKSLELGHPNYQHPARNEDHFDNNMDNFSSWLIYVSLLAISLDPTLYERFSIGQECLLFRRRDLSAPEASQLFRELFDHSEESIRHHALLLYRMLWQNPGSTPALDASEETLALLPDIKPGDVLQTEKTIVSESGKQIVVSRDRELRPRNDQRRTTAVKKDSITAKLFQVVSATHSFLSPITWIEQKLRSARASFEKGDYETSIDEYGAVYKLLEHGQNLANQYYIRYYLDALLGLGYAHSAHGAATLAANYYLLLLTRCGIDDRLRTHLGRVAFLLATARFADGRTNEALDVLRKSWSELEDLSAIIDRELSDQFFLSPRAAFDMLIAFQLDIAPSALEKEFGTRSELTVQKKSVTILDAAITLLVHLAETNTIQLEDQHSDLFFHLALLHRRSGEPLLARFTYQLLASILKACDSIEKARVALICCASLIVLESPKEALSLLQDLGEISTEELDRVVSAAREHAPVGQLIQLLLVIAEAFNNVATKSDMDECFRIACRLSSENDASAIHAIVNTADALDEHVVIEAFCQCFLSDPSVSSRITNVLMEQLVLQQKLPLITSLMARLEQSGQNHGFIAIVSLLLEQGDMHVLSIVSDNLKERFGRSLLSNIILDRPDNERLVSACCKPIQESVARLNRHSAMLTLTAKETKNQSLVLDAGCKEARRLFSLLELLSELETQGEVDANMRSLFEISNSEFVEKWLNELVEQNQHSTISTIIFRVSMHGDPKTLDRLIVSLAENDRSSFIDHAIANMVQKGCASLVVSLAHRLASSSDLTPFDYVSRALFEADPDGSIKKLTTLLEQDKLTSALAKFEEEGS
ncbi:MAG: hypothetical protein K2Z81_26810 [Cyanobacteria bacterium]|nr:hypothetical protein [Cyanobacteriota bacterium]